MPDDSVEILKICLLNILLLWVCAPLWAQTDTVATRHIDEVEVSAVSNSNDLRSLVPQYSISSKDFQRLNISDITSALRRLPGVTLRDYGGAGGMKTVSVRGLGASHTGVTLDGMLLSDVQSGQTDFQQFQLAEISSLSLSIAGINDIFQPARNFSRGSLMSISTTDSVSSMVALESGSWGYLSPSARLHYNINKVAISLQGGYTRANNDYPFTVENGIDTHRENRTNSRLSQGNINASMVWRFSTEGSLKTLIRLYDDDRQLPGIVHLYTNDNDETLRDRGSMVQTMLTSRLASHLWLKSGLRWNFAEQAYHNGIPSGGIKSERYINREYYATSALLYQPLKNLDFDYSIDYFHNSMTTTLAANPNPKRNSWLQSIAGKWSKDWISIVAMVLNSNIDTEHHWSPSLSASLKPFRHQDMLIRLSAKDIFRMPSMTEMYYYHIGQPNLRPEKTRQLNLGVTYAKTMKSFEASLTADIYINKVDDKIVAIPFNMFVWRYMNVEEVLGRGADMTASIACTTPSAGTFSLTANYSFQRTGLHNVVVEKFEGNQIAYSPVHSGSTTFAWKNPWVSFSMTLTGASEQWTNNEHNGTAMPAYKELAASLYRTFPLTKRQSIAASLTVQNLLNEQYCLIAHYPMPGRNIKLSITYKY